MRKFWRAGVCLALTWSLGGCAALRRGPQYYGQMTLQHPLPAFDPIDVPTYYRPAGLSENQWCERTNEDMQLFNSLLRERQLPYLFEQEADQPTITLPCAPPPGTVNSLYKFTLTSNGGATPITWSISAGSLPPGLTLSPFGLITGTPQAAGTSKFTVSASDSTPGTPQTDTAKLDIVVCQEKAPFTITTPLPLTLGTLNSRYRFTLQFCGGTAPVTWSITAGSLPSGLSLAPRNGVINGRPQTSGTFDFTVSAMDSTAVAVQTATANLSITVKAPTGRSRSGSCGPWGTDKFFVGLPLGQFESDDHIKHCVGAHIQMFSQSAEANSNTPPTPTQTQVPKPSPDPSLTLTLTATPTPTPAQPQTQIPKPSPNPSLTLTLTATPTPSPAQPQPPKDEFLQTTELVISTYLYTTEPADRLLKAYMLVSPLSPGVKFVEAPGPRAVQLIQVGSTTTAGQVAMTAGTPAGFPAALTLSPQLSRSVTENVARQYTTTNVEIFPLHNILFMSEDAGPGAASIDGNAVTEVSLRIPTTLCTYLDVFGTSSSDPAKQAGSGSQKPLEAKNVCYVGRVLATTASVAVVRAVTDNYRAIQEDNHNVAVIPFKTASVMELWTNPKKIYGVVLRQTNLADEQVVLSDSPPNGPVLFDDETQALKFRASLLKQSWDPTTMLGPNNAALKWGANGPAVTPGPLPGGVNSDALQLCVVGTPWPSPDADGVPANAVDREYCPLPVAPSDDDSN